MYTCVCICIESLGHLNQVLAADRKTRFAMKYEYVFVCVYIYVHKKSLGERNLYTR